MPDICTWSSNYTFFLQLLPSKAFITIWVSKWGQFWGEGVNSASRSRSIFGLYFFYLNLESTPSLAPVSSMSHLSSSGGSTPDLDPAPDPYLGCTFDLNFGSNLSPAQGPSMSHLCSSEGSTLDQDPAPDPYMGCTFWPEFSLYWYHVNPMLSSKLNLLSHISIPSGQNWKIPHK